MEKQKRIAIYPGTFDPVTLGHLNVLERALTLFDEVIVAIAHNPSKKPLFDFETRLKLLSENLVNLKNTRVKPINGLTVDFAKANNAVAIIRGLRAVSDFEYEFQLAQMNRHLDSSVETIFLMPSHKYFYTSSTIIKQVSDISAQRVSEFLPKNVLAALLELERA